MVRAIGIPVALAALVWSVWTLTAKADDAYRIVDPGREYASGATGVVPIQKTLSLNSGTLAATTATTARFIEAVRLACSATCFVAVSASNGASMADHISGGYLSETDSVIYRTNGGEYVIGISGSGSPTVYIQELSR